MSGRQSLADQLASIKDAAPTEYDPESVGFSFSSADKDLSAGRADYVEVGESRLRKNQRSELDGIYSGVKSSRKELFDRDNDSSGDEDDESADDDEEEEAEEQQESVDEEEGEGSDDEDEEIDSEEDEEDSESGDGEASTTQGKRGSASANSSHAKRPMEDDSREMLQILKQASSADVEKGRDVKKQLALWDTLLEARIRIQKCVTSANVLPAPRILGDYVAQSEEAASGTTEALEELSELLFTLREGLHRTNDKLTMPDSGESRKRKRGSTDYLDAALEDLANLSSIVLEHERSVITKWSDKISSASMNAGQQNKFKAIGAQNTLAQIEQTLAQDMARLVERTKVRRGTGGKVVKVVGRDKAREPVQGEKDIDQEVFDDADFYQALLREVVDATSTGNAGVLNGTPSAYAQFNQVSRKKAAGVDPKASKGRRLRFHVHETLQNFMAPVPMQTWEKEQIDELFRGLLGGNHAVQEEAAEEILQDDEYGIGATGEGAIRIF